MTGIELETLNQIWRGSPVVRVRGPLAAVREHVPRFERHPLTAIVGGHQPGAHPRLDAIVRMPGGPDDRPVPVAAVSKDYTLLPHHEVFDRITTALREIGVPPDGVGAEVKLTEHGERMALSVFLPTHAPFDPGDGHEMALRLECFNSVDGSLRFRALMGWFRYVCSNGFVVGVTMHHVSCRHVSTMPLIALDDVLRDGLARYETEQRNFMRWRTTRVSLDRTERWANSWVKDAWGAKAAARAWHIARTGRDAEVAASYQGRDPSRIAVTAGAPVPGAPSRCDNLFDLGQALAWLARQRRDVTEQLAWREGIPALLAPLEAI